ncbi:unnamed protein product [Parascedosporium putredinis]|uniref:CENP-V/GFA domain-containing protein n=1 Tax=Parascedosporium putredinis TaxID=1442378 RepID=A0A9P1GY32_9PEZI|nr:unnamed protein product [Parascedosporium putredinis]CAI7989578.1 unnamed protein product [Parascedosporium putredinis]
MSSDTTELVAQCLCKTHTFKSSVPSSSLPLSATCCHCDSCRHVTGAMFLVDVEWPNQDEDLSALHAYDFSPNLREFSCQSCGTRLFCKGSKPGSTLGVITGTLQNEVNLVRYDKHIYVGDTRDGGASMFMRKSHPDATPSKRFVEGSNSKELPADWPSNFDLPDPEAQVTPEFTPLYCHCRGVNLLLKNATDLKDRAPDKLPFYHPGTTAETFEHLPASTFDLKAAVASENKDPRLGTLEFYQSSPDVERYFCSKCAAVVFFAVHDRPNMVDVAPGLLDHPSGARAEGLLHWNFGTMGRLEDVEGGWREKLGKGVREEAEQWRIERGYPKTAGRVRREAGNTKMQL